MRRRNDLMKNRKDLHHPSEILQSINDVNFSNRSSTNPSNPEPPKVRQVREAWIDYRPTPRRRSCWDERPQIDEELFERLTPMDHSDGKILDQVIESMKTLNVLFSFDRIKI